VNTFRSVQSRLRETEDILNSLEALKDLVQTYLKKTSPRLENLLAGPHVSESELKKLEDLPSNRNTEYLPVIKAGNSPTASSAWHTKAIYFHNNFGEDVQSIGESLVKKLQDVFQLLAYKVWPDSLCISP
jgi:hypothetical protein